jgi:long-subunit acyl-CoA synthetase (AMP-forming)
LHLATSIRQQYGAGARVVIASHNRAEIVELMFAIWAVPGITKVRGLRPREFRLPSLHTTRLG